MTKREVLDLLASYRRRYGDESYSRLLADALDEYESSVTEREAQLPSGGGVAAGAMHQVRTDSAPPGASS